jgi:hypothetical protein
MAERGILLDAPGGCATATPDNRERLRENE